MKEIALLPRKRIMRMSNDSKKCAEAVNLIYVSDKEPGIKRIKNGKGYIYIFNKRRIRDTEALIRIKSLVIPPAWTNVWICRQHNGHIQCTGLDSNGRKQYKYHAQWLQIRSQTKYSRLYEFGKALPELRRQMHKDLSLPQLSEDKVIATAIAVMEKTYIRIGSNAYEKLYGSYGLTTLKDQHVKINGNQIEFVFKGKKSIVHKVTLKSQKLAKIVKQCRDIPGKELFQYKGEDGLYHSIDSGMVNNYIKRITGNEFTSKDFRTWAGTLNAVRFLKELEPAETITQVKKNVVACLDYVSKKLGNTRSVCKKYYGHPRIFELYESQELNNHLRIGRRLKPDQYFSQEERILMRILST